MAQWAVVIGGERYEAERLFHHDTLELTGLGAGPRPEPGDEVLVVAGAQPPAIVALGRVVPTGAANAPDDTRDPDDPQSETDGGPLVVAYTRRCFDAPTLAGGLALDAPVVSINAETYRRLAAALVQPADRRTWLVSVDLPIEADSPAEAVRQFWSYVMELGPRELPAFVAPADDELAMQAFVLGVETNLDPEEDDDE
jgi:hypothetical protein